MIESVRITGYRGLRDLSMEGLGRINLLVGKNNSGKTSVLEALYLMAARADSAAIGQVLSRRGEQVVETPGPGQASHIEVDICHLFHGHVLDVGTKTTIQTWNGTRHFLTFEISEVKYEVDPELFIKLKARQGRELGIISSANPALLGPCHVVSITGDPEPSTPAFPLSRRGGLQQDPMLMNDAGEMRNERFPRFITTDSLSVQEIQAEFSRIALSPREERVIRALQFIEPKIERMAIANTAPFSGLGKPIRGGLKVRLSGQDEPVPIGSLGEGIWRLMTLAMVISGMKEGLLLIDEIDTGLHYTVLEKMWTFIADAAKEFNVQVFATTHSADCVNSLAAVCRADTKIGSQVTIQRIEAEEACAVAYDEAEIVTLARMASARKGIEVR
ncbi:MAG: AAA family ATPase [Candidatus Accumulibacter sp.]|jgi:ABC-type branched-subunit amino acid transport system ATPase component|nr:AAA family ATPase [Accumulibacter sp.]